MGVPDHEVKLGPNDSDWVPNFTAGGEREEKPFVGREVDLGCGVSDSSATIISTHLDT